MRPVLDVMSSPGTIAIAIVRNRPASAWGTRCGIQLRGVAMPVGHDVSFQKGDRHGGLHGCGCGRIVRVTIVLPQHGQQRVRSVVAASSVGEGSGSSAGTASNRRQSARFSAR